MKRKIRVLLIAALLLTAPLIMLAQAPPHPNGGNNPTGGSNAPVGGAPIGNGESVILVLGLAYGAYKLYRMRTAAPAEAS